MNAFEQKNPDVANASIAPETWPIQLNTRVFNSLHSNSPTFALHNSRPVFPQDLPAWHARHIAHRHLVHHFHHALHLLKLL